MPDSIDNEEVGLPGLHGEQGNDQGHGGTGGDGGHGGRGKQGIQGKRGINGLDGIGTRGRQGVQGEPGEVVDAQTPLNKIAILVVVVLTALSAIYFASAAQNRLDAAEEARHVLRVEQDAYGVQIECQRQLLTETILGLKARSAFAETQAEVTLVLLRAQKTYLDAISVPEATYADQMDAFHEYQKALDFNIAATQDQLKVRNLNPYPTTVEIEECSP